MFINFCILPSVLYLDVGLEKILLFPIQIIAVIFYIIAIVICSKKIKLTNKNNIKDFKSYLMSIVWIFLPLIILIVVFSKEIILLNNSDLVLIYYDSENGGIGDGKTLTYTINQNYYKEVSIGGTFKGYKIEKFFTKSPLSLTEYKYNIRYNNINGNNKYYYSSEDINFDEINKTEFEYIILDIKKTYNSLNQIYIYHI